MKPIAFAFSSLVFASACMEPTTDSDAGFPNPLVMVGEAGAGAMAVQTLTRDGMATSTAFQGRAAGIDTFCNRNADILVLKSGQGLTQSEREQCKAMNGTWSAFSTLNGALLYVDPDIAAALIAKGKTSFLG